MELIDISAIIVAIVAALGAWAAQRAAARASRINMSVSGRLDAEKHAYERARAYDSETISRQTKEISDLRKENARINQELDKVKKRVRELERNCPDKRH